MSLRIEGEHMRGICPIGKAVAVHTDGHNHIKPEEGQVCQVIFTQRLTLKMRMNQSESSQTPSRGGIISFEVGEEEGFCITDDDVGDSSPSVDQDTDLSSDFAGELGQITGEFMGDDAFGPNFSSVDVLQASDVVCLQSGCGSEEFAYGARLPSGRLRMWRAGSR